MPKIIFFYLIILLTLSCKNNGNIDKFIIEKNIHNKFVDSYSNNIYKNDSLKMTIEFNSLWKIIVSYDKLDEYQKKLFDYFNSSINEVLFVGYNESLKIGVRCIAEELGYSNNEYKTLIKENNAQEFGTYKVKFLKEEEIILQNISGINLVYRIEINIHNVFIYNTLLFKKDKLNLRLDFWCKDSKYEGNEKEILEIFNSIDFFSDNENKTNEPTTDRKVEIEFKDKK